MVFFRFSPSRKVSTNEAIALNLRRIARRVPKDLLEIGRGCEVDSKTQELADTVETNEAAKQNKADTEDDLAADTKFLEDLKVRLKEKAAACTDVF